MRLRCALGGLLLLCALPSWAQERVRTIEKTYAFDPDGVVEVATYKGSITVVPWQRPEIEIQTRIEAEDIDGLILLPHVDIAFTGTTAELLIETDYRRALRRYRELFDADDTPLLPLVHYTIRLPETAHLKIEDYMSTTEVCDFLADLEVFTHKGKISLTNFGGALQLDTYMGKVHADFGRQFRDSALSSHEGTVSVRMHEDAAFELDAGLRRIEQLTTDFDLTTFVATGGRLQGSVNGGGPRLMLETTDGVLSLTHEPAEAP